MMRTANLVAVMLGLLVWSGAANAVDLIADGRIVTTFDDDGSTQSVPPAPFAPFNVSWQNSTISGDAFAGSGSGYGESDFFFFIAESKFDITFEATEPTDVTLSGFLTANSGDFGYANVRVRLLEGADMTSVIYSDNIDSDFEYEEGPVGYDGTLAPGIYRLVLQTDITPGGFDTTGSWDFTANFTTNDTFDGDSDSIPDVTDNCTTLANKGQADSDGDGFGNMCDADLDNDCFVGFPDLGIFASLFGMSGETIADLNSDGTVGFADLSIFASLFGAAPGPSGLPNACN